MTTWLLCKSCKTKEAILPTTPIVGCGRCGEPRYAVNDDGRPMILWSKVADFDAHEEPDPICGNCDAYIGDLSGQNFCMNAKSEKYGLLPEADYGCKNFFPDPKRWPEADHG